MTLQGRLPEPLARRLEQYFAHELVPIPLRYDSKRPLIRWQRFHYATLTDEVKEEVVAEFARAVGRYGRVNVGLVCGPCLLVLDVDNQKLFLSWLKDRDYPYPSVPYVSTRRGMHLYFRMPQGCNVSVRKRKDLGAELLGWRHYVVAPDSVVEGHLYRFMPGLDLGQCGLAEPPKWLIEEFIQDGEPNEEATKIAEEVAALLAPYWHEGQRHDLALGLAGYLRKLGIAETLATACVWELCRVTGDLREVRNRLEAVRDTYAKPLEQVAGAALLTAHLPEAVVDEVARVCGLNGSRPRQAVEGVQRVGLREWVARIRARAEAMWLVDGVLQAGSIMVVAGRPKAGKSILAASLAHAIGTGTPWLGRAVRRGVVLYLDYERPKLTAERLAEMGNGPEPTIATLLPPPKIDAVEVLQRHIEEVKSEYGLPVVVVIDTLGDFIAPALARRRANLNDYDAVAQTLQQLRELAAATGAAMVCIHHTHKAGLGEGEERELLGSTGISAKVDVVALLYTEREQEHVRRLCISGNAVERQTLYYEIGDRFTLELAEAPERTKLQRAVRAIRELLEGGPRTRQEILRFLEEEGLADDKEAAKKLFTRAMHEMGAELRRQPKGKEVVYGLRGEGW